MMCKDTGKYLGSPLVRNCFQTRSMDSLLFKFFRIFYIGDIVVETNSAMTIAASGDHNNDSIIRKSSFCSSHTFDSLINVLVKRITAVSGNSDITIYFVYACKRTNKITAFFMSSFHISGKRTNNLVISI